MNYELSLSPEAYDVLAGLPRPRADRIRERLEHFTWLVASRPPFHPLWLSVATDAPPMMRVVYEDTRVVLEVDQENRRLMVLALLPFDGATAGSKCRMAS